MGLIAIIKRIKTEARDLLELCLIPGIATFLPWAMCFKIFKRIALWSFLYREATEKAYKLALEMGYAGAKSGWQAARRLTTLIDHADLYLALSRSDNWMKRHLDVEGTWPQRRGVVLLCTFHWGAGMWGLRHAASNGHNANALVAAVDGKHFQGRSVLHAYAKIRTRYVSRALRCPTIDVTKGLKNVLAAYREKSAVLAAIDVPADQAAANTEIEFLGFHANVPRALIRMAGDKQVPIIVYMTGFDLLTGRRTLRIWDLGIPTNTDQMIVRMYQYLDESIRKAPPLWHFWSEADRFFVRPR